MGLRGRRHSPQGLSMDAVSSFRVTAAVHPGGMWGLVPPATRPPRLGFGEAHARTPSQPGDLERPHSCPRPQPGPQVHRITTKTPKSELSWLPKGMPIRHRFLNSDSSVRHNKL